MKVEDRLRKLNDNHWVRGNILTLGAILLVLRVGTLLQEEEEEHWTA